ncbi:hypothetical protein JZ751_002102 [Albula glossodonta]|uniref:Cytochrome P450 n=1 Tax=Albula glossodonta TaxID=121402 RepID=A0A8T2PHT0_9TELE|nr:hypothetical protein JZ751_002102 [Albula glossodonta]
MDFFSTLLLVGLVGALLAYINWRGKKGIRLPPGPAPLPLLGNLLQVDKQAPFKTFLERIVVLVGHDTVKEALLDRAEDFTDRAPIPFLHKVVKGYVSNVICALVFGRRFDYKDDNFLRLLETISALIRFGSSPWGQLYNAFPWLMERLPGSHHDVYASVEKIREFIREKIEKHQETLSSDCPRDYIDCFLIRLNKEKDLPTTEFTYDNMVATVLNLFFAGTETTSTTIRFALTLLIKYPHIQVIGRERCPNMEDRKSLPFTDAVIHEVQRVLDIVPLSLPRYATKNISFKGYTIPKVLTSDTLPLTSDHQDTVIIPLLHSVLRDDKQWKSPWSFNPDHFLDQNDNFKKSPAFMVFSAGKRSCVGESLARMELFLFLVTLLQHFTFTCPGGPDSLDISPELSSFANLPRKYQLIATPR